MQKTLAAILSLVLFTLLATPGLAEESFKVFPKESKIGFTLRHFANKASGTFGQYSGTLDFSKKSPQNSKVSFSVDVNTVDTANTKRDDHLREAEYFDVAKYPKMTFESKVFKEVGKNRYMVTGPLTIKGHTKNVSVPVRLEKSQTLWASGEEALEFSCQFKIDRTEFGVGEESSLLGSEVTIDLLLEFRKAP